MNSGLQNTYQKSTQNSAPVDAVQIEAAVQGLREEARAKWLRNKTSPKVCARTNILHIAYASDISDSAFRVLFGMLAFGDGGTGPVYVSDETIAITSGKCGRSVRRAVAELKKAGWLAAQKRGPKSDVRRFSLPENARIGIAEEVLALFERTDLSYQEAKKSTKSRKASKAPVDGEKDRTNLSGVLPEQVQSEVERPDKSVLSFPKDRTNLSAKPMPETEESPVIKKIKNPGIYNINILNPASAREEEADSGQISPQQRQTRIAAAAAAVAASVAAAAPLAAAPLQPPGDLAIEAPAPTCWATPRAMQAAFTNPHEAIAQREIMISPRGRLEVAGEFERELRKSFPLVELEAGLAAAEPNVQVDRGAIAAMQQVRRQFGYMQQDAARRNKAFAEKNAPVVVDPAKPPKFHPIYGEWNEACQCYFRK